MCPACIAKAAAMVLGAGSTIEILAVCTGEFTRMFRASSLGLFQQINENDIATTDNESAKGTVARARSDENATHRVGAGIEAAQQ